MAFMRIVYIVEGRSVGTTETMLREGLSLLLTST